jgi:hypothetical protein
MGNTRVFSAVAVACLSIASAGAQEKAFDWRPANLESVRLAAGDTFSGRVYRPAPDGGNIHVGIEARQPVTVAMTWADDWNRATQDPERMYELDFLCVREHVVNTIYECHLPSARPMILLVRDERKSHEAIVTGVGAVLGRGVDPRIFATPNGATIQYYSWACVENCREPEFQWTVLAREKYKVTTAPKVYNLLTPERDGQQLSIRIKASQPMTIAVLPMSVADGMYENGESLNSALSKTACKQRGIEKLSFECTFNLADGPQAIVVAPDEKNPPHKKAEIELQTVKCVANCDLMK